MTDGLSLQQMLANLKAQIEIHRDKEAYHAREEAAHRERREAHAAELATLGRHYDALKISAESAAPLASRYAPAPPEKVREKLSSGKPRVWSRLAERVIDDLPDGTLLTPTSLAEMMERHYENLPSPADPRTMSTILRRLARHGGVRLVQKGTSHREATYVKE